MKFNTASVEAIQVEHPDTIFDGDVNLKKRGRGGGGGGVTAVLLTASKHFNVGMHSDVYQ